MKKNCMDEMRLLEAFCSVMCDVVFIELRGVWWTSYVGQIWGVLLDEGVGLWMSALLR